MQNFVFFFFIGLLENFTDFDCFYVLEEELYGICYVRHWCACEIVPSSFYPSALDNTLHKSTLIVLHTYYIPGISSERQHQWNFAVFTPNPTVHHPIHAQSVELRH